MDVIVAMTPYLLLSATSAQLGVRARSTNSPPDADWTEMRFAKAVGGLVHSTRTCDEFMEVTR